MLRFAVPIALLLVGGCATTAPVGTAAVVGRWRCGPTPLHGTGFDVAVSTDTTYRADGRFSTLTRSVISRPGAAPVTTQDRAEGAWTLTGDVLRTTVQRATFVSSSDPAISLQAGQQLQDARLRQRAVFETRLRRLDAQRWQTSPVDGSGVDAVCSRG